MNSDLKLDSNESKTQPLGLDNSHLIRSGEPDCVTDSHELKDLEQKIRFITSPQPLRRCDEDPELFAKVSFIDFILIREAFKCNMLQVQDSWSTLKIEIGNEGVKFLLVLFDVAERVLNLNCISSVF